MLHHHTAATPPTQRTCGTNNWFFISQLSPPCDSFQLCCEAYANQSYASHQSKSISMICQSKVCSTSAAHQGNTPSMLHPRSLAWQVSPRSFAMTHIASLLCAPTCTSQQHLRRHVSNLHAHLTTMEPT